MFGFGRGMGIDLDGDGVTDIRIGPNGIRPDVGMFMPGMGYGMYGPMGPMPMYGAYGPYGPYGPRPFYPPLPFY